MLTCVSASDSHADLIGSENCSDADSNHNLELGENQDVLGEDYKSYSEFYNDIRTCGGTLEMNQSYKYSEGDINRSLLVDGDLVINGNGHIVDGSHKAYGLEFQNPDCEVTINNVTFANYNGNVLYFSGGKVTLNDVNFIDNSNGTEVLYIAGGELTLSNSNFKSNLNSMLIETSNTNVTFVNSNFSVNNCSVSSIYVNRGHLMVENCIFENISSKYGGAINYKGEYFTIKKSKFINTYARKTGGAILAKFFPIRTPAEEYLPPSEEMLIEECIFTNFAASHNGGAVYIDLDSGSQGFLQSLNIINCNFTDGFSAFGGAIVDQGGKLNIVDSNFINNSASHMGGAAYTSWADVTIVNSNFSNNSAGTDAGAIYFDYGKLTINQSNFTDNNVDVPSAKSANAIYANDVDAYLMNSIFDNGGVEIYANFANNSKFENVTSKGSFSMDNHDYIVSVENNGIKLNLVNNSIIVDQLPERFDLRDWGWASPIKNQGDNVACWAFAAAAGLETSLLKATGVLYNLSEENIQNLQLRYFISGDARNNGTGFAYSGLGHSLSWFGVVTAQDDPYDERGMISEVVTTENRIHLQDALIIFGGRNDTIELIKWAIMKYGAVTVQFNPTTFIHNYDPNESQPTHFVPLVGWDDTITAETFICYDGSLPEGPGGWIVKDSEGNIGDNGYDYISFYDKSFLANDYYAIVPQNAAVAYIFENTIDYHVNYQTDLAGLTGFDGNYTYYSNEFTSEYDELIGAVGTYFNESGIKYSFDIYVNGKKLHSQSGISEFSGFRTIVLSKYIPIKKGDKFKVVFKSNALPYQAFSRQHYIAGMSLASANGKSWTDLEALDKTVCLKVYTVKDDTKIINNKNIAVDYAGGSYFSVKVVTADGRAVGAGEVVKFTINGKTTTVKTNNNGIAKIKITNVPKKYKITTSYKGKTYKNTITVKQVLKAKKVTVKKTAKRVYLTATLKINGKLVKGKVIKFKFKGKTYKARTNKKGIAKVTVKKSIIKKLKKGKTYTVKVTYLKDTIKTTVKVKR